VKTVKEDEGQLVEIVVFDEMVNLKERMIIEENFVEILEVED